MKKAKYLTDDRYGMPAEGERGYDPKGICWEDLAQAIIFSAAEDYRRAASWLRVCPGSREHRKRKTECEQFFRSRWFCMLTDTDPAAFLKRLEKEAAE